ncbi:hypothetical protein GUJ93_ZPchr0010g9793 [Zizania palustris]|uniref:Uncharacterized protein n=1 Tax=Zizania palustris TaxID=103762 RepID=A0A8J6BAB2_ZIZPA|nr:hypothetical protein GUJ93_ZPchr0010g9793 [Zizania palustris]
MHEVGIQKWWAHHAFLHRPFSWLHEASSSFVHCAQKNRQLFRPLKLNASQSRGVEQFSCALGDFVCIACSAAATLYFCDKKSLRLGLSVNLYSRLLRLLFLALHMD